VVLTTLDRATRSAGYEALARERGGFAMVALDQRGSIEALFRDANLAPDEGPIDDFRSAAAAVLIPDASAILLERGFLSRRHTVGAWTAHCGLIVAADHLVQPVGKPVEASHLDPPAADLALTLGAPALKLLVLWHAGSANLEQVAMVQSFIELAHSRSMIAIVEGIVRAGGAAHPPTAGVLVEAAARLSAGADIYKAQVPIHGGDSPAEVEALSRELTAAIRCPWVVLSAGVPAERFPEFVAASCRGGASGFLAGRAIWGASITAPDQATHLQAHAAPRLRELAAIVDAEGRPWREAGSGA
jgi:sulfofructosephosphate aldolase